MSLPKRTLILAGALCALGLVLRVLGVEWGLDVLVVATLVAVLSAAFMGRAAQHDQATFRRNVLSRLQASSKELEEIRSELAAQGKIQRTTLYYAKNGSTSAGGGGGGPMRLDGNGQAIAGAGGYAIAGRSSTPEVSNARARHSFAGLLDDPERAVIISGIMTPAARAALPEGSGFRPFLPFHAAETLTAAAQVAMIVVDKACFRTAPWDRAVGPVGIGMMKDLDHALRQAVEQDIQIVILEDSVVPDLHTSALDSVQALRLPLTAAQAESASGAPAGQIVTALGEHLEKGRVT